MAVPIVTTSYVATGSNTISLHIANVVVGATTNPMIIVMHNCPTNAAMNGATWNSQNFTLIPGFSSNNFWAAAAYLIPSGTGTHDVICSFPFFFNTNVIVSVAVLAGATGIGPHVTSANPVATSVSTTLTTTQTDSMVIHFTMNDGSTTQTQGGGQTVIQNNTSGADRSVAAYKTASTLGTAVTMSASNAGTLDWQMNTFEVLSTLPTATSNFFTVF